MIVTGVFGMVLPALLVGSSPTLAAEHMHYRSSGWDLRISKDRFSVQTRCTLVSTNERMRYQPGAIGFLMRSHLDTLGAWYRVDDAATVRWQDRTAELINAGVEIDGTGIEDPTGGWVWIPMHELSTAKVVSIRPTRNARIRRITLGGFQTMLDAAQHLGCASDDAFRG